MSGVRMSAPLLRKSEFIRGILFHGTKTTFKRHDIQRSLFLTSQSYKSQSADDEDLGKPIKFSTSKASHRTWKVDRSLGSHHQRPWWKVVPVSLIGIAFLFWCAFRQESEIDQQLEKQLYEHLPGLLEDEESEVEDAIKPNS